MGIAPLVFVIWALGAQAEGAAPVDNLAAAKALYASASYEEALARLSAAHDGAAADEADQYRALCLLALGRTPEAERAIEDLVTRRPLFHLSETDVSPRLVTMFHDVRRRVLPDAAKDLFTTAKTSFSNKNYEAASDQLEELLSILADDDVAGAAGDLSDLKMLGEGFLKLTQAELASAAKAKAATQAAAAAASKVAAAAADAATRVYTEADSDVVPPADIARTLPEWRPPNAVAEHQQFRGVIRLLINPQGRVESASMIDSVSTDYDALLLAAARDWRFQPARRDGQPVKYLKLITIVLSGR